jgi:hypothetical protein
MKDEHHRYYNNVGLYTLISASRALLKFCRDHKYPEGTLATLQQCLAALETDDVRIALEKYRAIPQGGMGTFSDWMPPVVNDLEDEEYVDAVFCALLERFNRLMNTAAGNSQEGS